MDQWSGEGPCCALHLPTFTTLCVLPSLYCGTGTSLERLPGLTELMAWIDRRGVKRAAVTNAPRANAELMLRGLGLDVWFSQVWLGETVAGLKDPANPHAL